MPHTALIAVHATSASAALLLGVLAFPRGRFLTGFLAMVVTMEVSLVLAVAAGWSAVPAAANAVFCALAVLGVVMCWRSLLAVRGRPGPRATASSGYLGHVGFVLVSLTDAFLVVAVLNAGAPVWAVVASGVAVGVAGHFALVAASSRVLGRGAWRTSPVR